MGHETTLRANLAKIYVLISESEMNPDRMELASLKIAEVIGVLDGTVPLEERPEVQEKRAG